MSRRIGNGGAGVVLVIATLLLGGCGGSDTPRSGLDGDELLLHLSYGEVEALCAWFGEVCGGTVCEDGTPEAFSQTACVDNFSSVWTDCTATVRDWEDCLLSLDECGETPSSKCDAVFYCTRSG